MSKSGVHLEQRTESEFVNSERSHETLQLVVTSPGRVDMHGIIGLANAMKIPVSVLSKKVYQAPAVLIPDVLASVAPCLVESCQDLGLDVSTQSINKPTVQDTARFDLAVHITDAALIPATVETVARMVGVSPEQAYQMIASPPGLILGDVSTAAANAVRARLPDGVGLSMAPSGVGPFDVFVPPDAPNTASITTLCGIQRGLVQLGLSKADADAAFARLPKGTARLVARDLIPCDLVLASVSDLSRSALDWLAAQYGVDDNIHDYIPIALEEGLTRPEGLQKVATAAEHGVILIAEPAGFDRCAVQVTRAPDIAGLSQMLKAAGLDAPSILPAIVAQNLPDLDARWLACQLEQHGAHFLFIEDAP